MISIKNITSAAQAKTYYEEGYYSQDAERPTWWGKGAELQGMQGDLHKRVFDDALDGKLPNGEQILRHKEGKERPAIDVTFSPPKSVSLQLLVGGDERIRRAHDRAVESALTYLEHGFAQARITEGGITRSEKTGNFMVARMQHETSRELDPQLHTHCLVLNATQRSDGAWRALDNAGLYNARASADALYRAELAASIRKLGYEVERTRSDGQFEIAGYTHEQLRAFSKRREQIEEALKERGEHGAKAAERANLMTRAAKEHVPPEELEVVWKREAKAQGIVFPEPAKERAEPIHEEELAAARRAVEHALDHLTERSTVVSRRDVVKHALQLSVGRIEEPKAVFVAIDALMKEGTLMDAKSRHAKADALDLMWTTTQALSTEKSIVHALHLGADQLAPMVAEERVHEAAQAKGLTEGQGDAVRLALTSRDRVVGIQGYAGTGKTYALQTVRELAEEAGFTVRGCAPSAAAANLLNEDAGIDSKTVARHLIDARNAPNNPEAKELWVVAE